MAWNASGPGYQTNGTKPNERKPVKTRWVFLSVIAAILAAVVGGVLLLNARKTVEVKPQTVKKTKVVNSARVIKKVAQPTPIQTNATVQAEITKGEFVKRPGALQLPNGKVLTFPPPAAGETRTVFANGHTYVCDHLGNFTDTTRRKLFKSAFELNFLGLACEGKPYIPAFLVGLDKEQVQEYLSRPYQPIGDETEEELAQLKSYEEMRQAAINYIAQGGDFDDFVTELAKFDRKQRETHAMTLRETMLLFKQGKIQEAKDMADAANIVLKNGGFKPLKLPRHVQAAFDGLKK